MYFIWISQKSSLQFLNSIHLWSVVCSTVLIKYTHLYLWLLGPHPKGNELIKTVMVD